MTLPRRVRSGTATLTVVASMIGTGVFTTTGFLVRDVGSPIAILVAWALGGLISLAGALCYAELGAAVPHNGGEYRLLGRVYHPAVGFLAGWVSLVVGFSAPAAAAALAFARYATPLWPDLPPVGTALALVLGMAVLHGVRVGLGGRVQNLVTLTQVVLIAVFVAGGLAGGESARLVAADAPPLGPALVSPAFAVGLIYVSFAYSGWNAAAYLAGELEEPGQTLPRALVQGTLLVAALYLGLNAVFLGAAPPEALSGVVEVGHVAAVALFGEGAGATLSFVIALGLAASVSAFTMTGPRVTEAMGADHPRLGFLTRRVGTGGPLAAIGLQAALTSALVVTAAFDTLLAYIGFTLSIFAGLTAFGVVVFRRREPDLPRPYRTFGYPWTPIAFALVTLWIVVHALIALPAATGAGLLTLAVGGGLYVLLGHRSG